MKMKIKIGGSFSSLTILTIGLFTLNLLACESSDSAQRAPVVAANYETDTVTGESFTFDPNKPREHTFDKIDSYFYPINPPVYIGDQRFSSVNAAVDSAQEGDVISLGVGIYTDPVLLKSHTSLTLRADKGPAYFLTPASNQPAMHIQNAENIRLVNLYFRHDNKSQRLARIQRSSTVKVSQSANIIFDHCYINGSGFSGLDTDRISGTFTLRETIIEESSIHALLIDKSADLDSLIIDKCLMVNGGIVNFKGKNKGALTYIQLTNTHIDRINPGFIKELNGPSVKQEGNNITQSVTGPSEKPWPWKPSPDFIHASVDSAAAYPLISQGLIDNSPVPKRGALSVFYPAHIEAIPDWVKDGSAVFAPCFNGNLTPVKLEVKVKNEISCDDDSLAFYNVNLNCPAPFFFKLSPFPLGEIPLPNVERLGDYHWRLYLKGKPYDLRMLRSAYADGKYYGETCSYNMILTTNEGARQLYHFADNPRYMDRPGLSWAGDINHDGHLDLWMNLGMAEGRGNLALFISHTDKATGKVIYMVVYVPVEVTIC